MRKSAILMLLAAVAITSTTTAEEKHQSFFTYEDGGTIVRQGEDSREIEARVNLPLFPGDEVTTNRRGRVEIRLSDGNVIGIDRASSVLFRSILDSYDGDSSQTIAELRFGHVIIHRTDHGRDLVRLDTASASYVASREAIYSVEADSRGKDRVTVFEGSIEVRTPTRTTRLRASEEAHVDDQGLYGLVSSGGAADDFERWFLKRAERYNRASSKYLDRSLAYADHDLETHGSWIYVSGFAGYAWRPRVTVGWRPYYHGRWAYSRSGCLTWVSYEPWGWVPYHYGRWAYDPIYGWVWLPGLGYAPAWVYWMYGPGYVGWAPYGWYDCYRPYYNWAYRPYSRARLDFGFGFYGRVRVDEVDLRPWTFVGSGDIVSDRIDRAALTTDAVRERLLRGEGRGVAVVSGAPARFSKPELKDPGTAVHTIYRRGLGSGTGKEGTGSPADMTPFFRRDPDLSPNVRERIVRTRGSEPPSDGTSPSGVVGRNTGGSVPAGGGSVTPIIGGGGRVRREPDATQPGEAGVVRRGTTPATGDAPEAVVPRRRGAGSAPAAPADGDGDVLRRGNPNPSTETPSRDPAAPGWRDRSEGRVLRPANGVEPAPAAPSTSPERRDTSWRTRAANRGGASEPSDRAPRAESPAAADRESRGSDVPRRVIDGIGGARVYSGGSDRGSRSSGSREGSSSTRERSSEPRSGASAPRASGGSRDSSPPPRVERSSPPPAPAPAPSSPPPSSSNNDGGGRVQRDRDQ